MTSSPLDALDLRLLELIQANSRMSQSELGERVHLSTAAVNRRLKRMRDDGVIRRYGAVLAPAALGHPLSIVAEVEVESERIDLLDAMKQSFRACPQVQQCYYVTGEWDFILVLVVQDMAQYTALSRQLFFQNNNVKRFRTLVTMDPVKVSLDVPVRPA
ncbi:Lrp/AsnC family transcriptional regulator [Variovorax sp. ZS18.2.2]|uniref:Lrp/AsnC family transcriptional regulator n=1 Tax=Variovorax sp. ZS18.2.2 TaxID=2971255 RepID=UPI002151D9C6|nr:Lrp/AsnC family transcriptional regulator [Variovorax sp. ZS18.2.2]MCR6477636.1 Lrp/AsnC family transcriptional regulator [Variovorax sp. ZS18.2.2]